MSNLPRAHHGSRRSGTACQKRRCDDSNWFYHPSHNASVLQAWSTTDQICSMDDEKCEMFEVKYDLSEGDTFTLEVIEGEVSVTAVLPDGSTDPNPPFSNNIEDEWEFTATSSGVHNFGIMGVEESTIDYSISRGIIYDYGFYPLGALILSFGILKRLTKQSEDETLDAVLDD